MINDLLTNEVFKPKRRNQKFASSQNRIAFNNLKATLERNSKSFIDKPLQKNHRILMGLIQPNEEKALSKELLTGKGFNFFVMSHYELHKNKTCPALYNFIIVEMAENSSSIKIFRKDDTII